MRRNSSSWVVRIVRTSLLHPGSQKKRPVLRRDSVHRPHLGARRGPASVSGVCAGPVNGPRLDEYVFSGEVRRRETW